MIDKGMVKYDLDGKNRRYRPAISKSAYFSNKMKGIVSNFFGNSNAQFASFFTQSSDFTKAELEELKLLIEDQIKLKKKSDGRLYHKFHVVFCCYLLVLFVGASAKQGFALQAILSIRWYYFFHGRAFYHSSNYRSSESLLWMM